MNDNERKQPQIFISSEAHSWSVYTFWLKDNRLLEIKISFDLNYTMLKIIGKLILQLSGWKIVDKTPLGINKYPKAVIIAVPHTSNWDYPYAMATLYAMGCKIRYLAKDSLFKFPLGIIIRGLGGIPVNRSQKNNFPKDSQSITFINMNCHSEKLVICISDLLDPGISTLN